MSQEIAIARGEWIDPALAKITVGEWVQQWHRQQVKLKRSTRVRYDVAIRCQILPDWENVALSRVAHSDLSAWVQRLSASGLAPATIRYAHRVLSLALSAPVKDGRIVRNVAEGVDRLDQALKDLTAQPCCGPGADHRLRFERRLVRLSP